MNRADLAVVQLTLFLSFATLFSPQPLLPLLGEHFSISEAQASTLIAAVLLPLGVAPVIYGYFLQAVPARSLLRISLFLLAVDQLAILFVVEYRHLLMLRLVQGLLVPGIFTALMTYCSVKSDNTTIRFVMSLYVATTIVGGVVSRLLSGWVADSLPWQAFFGMLGAALLISAWLVGKMDADAEINFDRLDKKAFGRVLRLPDYLFSYMALFLVSFCFSAMLNYLPFRLRELVPDIRPFGISLAYLGYLAGLFTSLSSPRLVRAGGERQALLVGAGLLLIGLAGCALHEIWVLYVFMLCNAGGFFLFHSVLAGLINHRAAEHGGIVNGLYVSTYYLSAGLGAWLPFYLFGSLGWGLTLAVLCLVLVLAGAFVLNIPERRRASLGV